MPELEKTIDTGSTVKEAYDTCKKFFQGLGYDINETGEPTYLAFEKKGSIWAFHDIKATHQIRVTIRRKDDSTLINLNYDAPEGIGGFSQKSKDRIDNQVKALDSKIQDMVERRELIEKEKRYRMIFDQAPLPVMVLDPESGDVRDFNESASTFLQYDEDEFSQTSMPDWIAERKEDEIKEDLQKALRIGRDKYEDVAVTKNGDKKDVLMHLQIFTIKREVAIYLMMVDITERKQKERRTKDLNSLLMTIRNISQLIHKGVNFDMILQRSTSMLEDTRDYSDVTIAIYDDNKDMITPAYHSGDYQWTNWGVGQDGVGNAPECVKTVLETKSTEIIESTDDECGGCDYCLHEPDRKCVIVPMLEDEEVIGTLMIGIDIADLSYKRDLDRVETYLLGGIASTLVYTKEKLELKQDLEKTDEKIRWLMERTPNPILVIDRDGMIEFANKELCKKTGYKQADMIGKSMKGSQIMSEEEHDKVMDDLMLKMAGEDIESFEMDLSTDDGKGLNMEAITKLLKENGRITGEIMILKESNPG